jgi:hypothetical protein
MRIALVASFDATLILFLGMVERGNQKMMTIHKLTVDLQKKGELQRMDVVQGDAGVRYVELTLCSDGEPWEIPAQTQLAVRYLKPDGTTGIYDRMPDGMPCFSFSGNAVTVKLAPQMLTCAGAVQTQVELSLNDCRIATFTFLIVVEQAVAMDKESGDYVNWKKVYLPQLEGAVAGQYLRVAHVDNAGRVLELETAEVDTTEDLEARVAFLEKIVPEEDATEALEARLDFLESVVQEMDNTEALEARIAFLEKIVPEVDDRTNDASNDAFLAMRAAENAVPSPQNANVGQTIAVKEVDENGKPTVWEAVDLPTGGSGGTWETIIDYTVPEDCAQVFLKTDINGNPFKLKEAIVTFLLLPAADVTAAVGVRYTVDGSITNPVYNVEHYAHGAPSTPTAVGKCTVFKIHVVDTPFGVHLIRAAQAKDVSYSENAWLGVGNVDVYEPFNSSTLKQLVSEISGAGVGGVVGNGAAIGAGSRIVMVGVRG